MLTSLNTELTLKYWPPQITTLLNYWPLLTPESRGAPTVDSCLRVPIQGRESGVAFRTWIWTLMPSIPSQHCGRTWDARNVFVLSLYILQRGVQWKQGVVICMVLYASLLCNTTPIHCTPHPLHPPLQSIQYSFFPPGIEALPTSHTVQTCEEIHLCRGSVT